MSDIVTVRQLQEVLGAAASTNTVVLLDFYAPWCGPCKKMQPTLDQVQAQYGDKLRVVKLNVDTAVPALQEHFQVKSVPTFIWVKHNQVVGVHAGADATAFIDKCAQVLSC